MSAGTEAGGAWVPILFAGFFAVLVAVGTAAGGRKRRYFEELAERLRGEAGGNGFLQNFYFKGFYKGRPLLIKYHPGGKNSPSSLAFTLEDPLFLFDLDVTAENLLEKALDSIGLTGDLRSGDEEFDSRFRVKSSIKDLAARYLAAGPVRERIRDLFNAGAVRLRLEPRGTTIPGCIRFTLESPDLEKVLDLRALTPLLDLLCELSSPKLGAELFGAPPPGLGRARG